MKKHFVDNHASCDKGKDVIQHLKIDLESLSEVILCQNTKNSVLYFSMGKVP